MTEPTTEPRRDLRALPDPEDPRATAEAILFEVRARHRRPGPDARAGPCRPARGRPRPPRGRARPGQDADHQDARRRARWDLQAHPVHARPRCHPTWSAPRIYRPGQAEFETELGPVFANFLLADEINRAPAKVQSALLEVMQEHQVTIGGTTYPVPEPFLVLATENPIEAEGTYPLPEAQVDRFMLKVLLGYPSAIEEAQVVARSLQAGLAPREVLDVDGLRRLQAKVLEIYVDRASRVTPWASSRPPVAWATGARPISSRM